MIPIKLAYRSANIRESKLPTHKNLKDRIAALHRLNQQNNASSTSPNPSATPSSPDPPLATTNPNNIANNNTKGSLRERIAKFEAAGEIPIPRGSFGMGAMPFQDDGVSRRKGEMLGNRVPGLNRPKALPTEGLGMVSKSHLTVKPVAKDSIPHSRRESQSLGNYHRRYTSQSYSTLTSPSLSAYDGEGTSGLSEVDEFGGLNGFSTPQTPYSPASTFSSLPSPEVSAIDKLPGKLVIPNRFQRRVASDFQASYGFTREITPDPEMPLQPLEEGIPLSSEDCGSRSQPEVEAESVPDPQTHDDQKEPEVQPPTEQTSELEISTPEADSPPPPIDSSQEAAAEATPEPPSNPIPAADVVEEDDDAEDDQRSSDTDQQVQDQDHDSVHEVSKPNPIPIPLSSVRDSVDASPPASPKVSTSSTPVSIAGTLPDIVKEEEPSELVEEAASPVEPAQYSDDTPTPDDAPTPEEPPASPTLAFPLPPTNASQLQTPPESPKPAPSISTTASDLSDSTIDYQGRSNHPDPDHDLFVLPLPKDDELPPRTIVQEVAVTRSMHQVLASPLPTLQAPIDFPITTVNNISTRPSDPNINFTGDESLALDASQAEIIIAQSEVIRPASPTLLVAMPSPSPTATTFRAQTPPPLEEPLSPPDEVDNTRASPPRIRKKLYTNNSAPTNFKDSLLPPPTQQSFSAVVREKTRASTYAPPLSRIDTLAPKPSIHVNAFMTPKKKQSLFAEPMTPASPGSELAFLVKNAAILEAQLQHGVGSSGDDEWDKQDLAQQSSSLFTEPLPQSALRPEMVRVKSASTPTLASTSVTPPDHTPPVPDLVYDYGSLNSGLSSIPLIPPFFPQLRSRKSGALEESDRRSLAPSHKSRKSEKSSREKDKNTIPRARKLSSRLRSLANSSTNSLKSLGRPSLSSETSVSFDSPTTVSIEPMTPQDTGSSESRRLGLGMGSPGSRSQLSQGSGSEWNSPPRKRDVLGRATSFADRLLSRAGKSKSGFLDNSQGNILDRHRPSIDG